ncbi:unnamed protein product [Closterium sp. NIES-64]|nr:unnamed protein product [Closterium sp. NIES-64]
MPVVSQVHQQHHARTASLRRAITCVSMKGAASRNTLPPPPPPFKGGGDMGWAGAPALVGLKGRGGHGVGGGAGAGRPGPSPQPPNPNLQPWCTVCSACLPTLHFLHPHSSASEGRGKPGAGGGAGAAKVFVVLVRLIHQRHARVPEARDHMRLYQARRALAGRCDDGHWCLAQQPLLPVLLYAH